MAGDDLLNTTFEEHHRVAEATAAAVREPFERLLSLSGQAIRDGGKLLFFGNGGSAADAQHLATELTVRFGARQDADRRNRARHGYLGAYRDRQRPGLRCAVLPPKSRRWDGPATWPSELPTSGRSRNVVLGLKTARDRGLVAAAFTGQGGGDLIEIADPLLMVPSHTTARIQEMHITLGHALCAGLERALGLV